MPKITKEVNGGFADDMKEMESMGEFDPEEQPLAPETSPLMEKMKKQAALARGELDVHNKAVDIAVPVQQAPPTTVDGFVAALSEADQEIFKELSDAAHLFPEGYTTVHAYQDKKQYGDIWLVPLKSGSYVYRGLTSPEEKEIRKTANGDEDIFSKLVVRRCIVAPVMDMMTLNEALAGTVRTLHTAIYEASDFATAQTVTYQL